METKQVATIGIDVSKKNLDSSIVFTDESYLNNCFSNNVDGIKQLLTWLAEQGGQGCPLGLEATGGLELELCF